ncbi:MAG: hypothetical protein ACK559_34865, partial [bacterium]
MGERGDATCRASGSDDRPGIGTRPRGDRWRRVLPGGRRAPGAGARRGGASAATGGARQVRAAGSRRARWGSLPDRWDRGFPGTGPAGRLSFDGPRLPPRRRHSRDARGASPPHPRTGKGRHRPPLPRPHPTTEG